MLILRNVSYPVTRDIFAVTLTFKFHCAIHSTFIRTYATKSSYLEKTGVEPSPVYRLSDKREFPRETNVPMLNKNFKYGAYDFSIIPLSREREIILAIRFRISPVNRSLPGSISNIDISRTGWNKQERRELGNQTEPFANVLSYLHYNIH